MMKASPELPSAFIVGDFCKLPKLRPGRMCVPAQFGMDARPSSGQPSSRTCRIGRGVTIVTDDDTQGSFAGSGSQDLKTLEKHSAEDMGTARRKKSA